MSSQRDTAKLLSEAIAGDRIALQALLIALSPRLLAYLRRVMPADLHVRLEAEDVFQDTCVEAYRRIGAFQPQGDDSFARWLMTIARHRMSDLLSQARTQKRGGGRMARLTSGEEASGIFDLLEALAVHYRTPSLSAARREIVIIIEQSIDQLPEDYRRAIRLRHVDGLDVAEAAARMNRSAAAFRMLCMRGLQELQLTLRSRSVYV